MSLGGTEGEKNMKKVREQKQDKEEERHIYWSHVVA
jgi:hypothetical protein